MLTVVFQVKPDALALLEDVKRAEACGTVARRRVPTKANLVSTRELRFEDEAAPVADLMNALTAERHADNGRGRRRALNIRGNEWQGRHYVNLQAWRLQNLAAGGGDGYASPPVASSGGASASPFDAPFSSFTADPPADGGAAPKKDDVPF